MYIISFVNILVRTVHYLQTNGVLLRVNQPPLPFSHLCMIVKRLCNWIMEVKSVLDGALPVSKVRIPLALSLCEAAFMWCLPGMLWGLATLPEAASFLL